MGRLWSSDQGSAEVNNVIATLSIRHFRLPSTERSWD